MLNYGFKRFHSRSQTHCDELKILFTAMRDSKGHLVVQKLTKAVHNKTMTYHPESMYVRHYSQDKAPNNKQSR